MKIVPPKFDCYIDVTITCVDRNMEEFEVRGTACYTREFEYPYMMPPREIFIPEGFHDKAGRFLNHKEISGIMEDLEFAETNWRSRHRHDTCACDI